MFNYFYFERFLIQFIFLAAARPKLNLLFHFSTMKYIKQTPGFVLEACTTEKSRHRQFFLVFGRRRINLPVAPLPIFTSAARGKGNRPICLSTPEVELGFFSISVHFKISKVQIFGAPRLHSWGK